MNALYGLPLNVQFCRRCVISNQRPNSAIEFSHTAQTKKETIHFDEEGVCDACRVAEAKASTDWDARERELQALCDEHRSKSGAYDCIVPGSGGKDSYLAASVLRKRFGMHPLTVTWAPHLYTDVGRRNFDRWCATNDNFLCTPSALTHRLLTRLAVENLFHPFQPFMIGQKALAPKMALLFRIPLVFYGENEAEYGNPKADAEKSQRDTSYYAPPKDIYLGGTHESELRGKYGLTSADLAPYMPSAEAAAYADVRYLGYYMKWKPQEAYYYAAEHGGFEAAPERTPGTYSKYNSLDDKIDDLHYFTTYIKFGIGRASYDASQEIRSGDITREEAVSLVRRFDGEYPSRFEREVFEYLSFEGFPQMTRAHFDGLVERFKSPHLWNGNVLRHTVHEMRLAA